MQFVPLWTSILRSRKVAALPDDLYRTWTLCLATAQEHDHAHGSLPSVDDLSYSLHMSKDNCLSRLSRLVTLEFLDLRDGIYYVHDWDDWKHRPDPTSTARKRAQREREKEQTRKAKDDADRNGAHDESKNVTVTPVTSVTSQNVTMSRPNSPTPIEEEEEEYARENALEAPDELLEFGLQTFGPRFEMDSINAKIAGWRAAKYSDGWIKDAMLCANCSAEANISAYINKVLREWRAKGGPDASEIVKAQTYAARQPVEYFTGSKNLLGPPGVTK